MSISLPSIFITRPDHARLTAIATAPGERDASVRKLLADELARAAIVAAGEAPPTLVTMHARVAFRDDESGQTSDVTLVYPEEADIAAGKISVLTPIGATLIGLSEGQSIEWRTRTGLRKKLTVLKVTRTPG